MEALVSREIALFFGEKSCFQVQTSVCHIIGEHVGVVDGFATLSYSSIVQQLIRIYLFD